nr:MAG TPA: hypothetical protein [Caudoviricetes sp.]
MLFDVKFSFCDYTHVLPSFLRTCRRKNLWVLFLCPTWLRYAKSFRLSTPYAPRKRGRVVSNNFFK